MLTGTILAPLPTLGLPKRGLWTGQPMHRLVRFLQWLRRNALRILVVNRDFRILLRVGKGHESLVSVIFFFAMGLPARRMVHHVPQPPAACVPGVRLHATLIGQACRCSCLASRQFLLYVFTAGISQRACKCGSVEIGGVTGIAGSLVAAAALMRCRAASDSSGPNRSSSGARRSSRAATVAQSRPGLVSPRFTRL